MRWAGYVAQKKRRNACRLMMGKLNGKRPRHRWVDNISMDVGEIG
jgi:hypothetical protein